MDDDRLSHELTNAYRPAAIYYEASDSLEYVRDDEPSIYRRIDPLLTLIVSMRTRKPMGFRLKGFKHFYLRQTPKTEAGKAVEFPLLVAILEEAMGRVGGRVFDESEKLQAYTEAKRIAEADHVVVKDLIRVA